MQNKYFNVNFEFNKEKLHQIIKDTINNKQKGYVCVVDGNVLTTANKNEEYKDIINGSLANTCDGSSIAMLAGLIHKKVFKTYTGPDLFANYICQDYKQYFLGNTEEKLASLKRKFESLNYNIDLYKFQDLPFKDVDDFDYKKIAEDINAFSPDIIWVSLGAPKQEWFISKLIPYVNHGLLFAIGAAFNLFLNDNNMKRAPKIVRKLNMEWVYRIFQEPKRVGKRALNYFILLPVIILKEIKQVYYKK